MPLGVAMTAHIIGNGDTITISATPPTKREDGTPLGTIDHYTRYLSYNNETPIALAVDVVDGAVNETIDVDTLGAGTFIYWLTVTETNGLESGQSGHLVWTVLDEGTNVTLTFTR